MKDADEDESSMILKVAYMPDETIEKDADALIAEYAHARQLTIKLPIPVDDIVEKHLKLAGLGG